MKKHIELFNLFVSKDDLKPDLLKPCKQNGFYYATDAYSLIYMPTYIMELPFEEQSKPHFDKVIPKTLDCNISFDFNLLKQPKNVELMKEVLFDEVKCEQCNGDGYLECDLGHNHDCKNCDGVGYYETNRRLTGRLILPNDKYYKIDGVVFSSEQINKLVRVCEILNVTTINKLTGNEKKGNIFSIGNVNVLMMPKYYEVEDKIIKLV
jgi:hypothetical protein